MEIRTVAIVGAGTMGCGIAQTVAQKGIDVILVEIDNAAMGRALLDIGNNLDRQIQKWGITESEKRAILARIKGTADPNLVTEADILIEAIPESLRLKAKLYQKLDQLCSPEMVYICNTSTLSLTEIASTLQHPETFIGMHFLYPVPKIPMVEIVRGLKTSDATYEKAQHFAHAIGKEAVEVYEYPGYITTRVMLPFINEAMHVVMEGVASATDVDKALKLGYGLPTPPLEMADQMGLDIVMSMMEHLFRELGDLKYRPCPMLRKLVRAGHLGIKTGRGIFEYENGEKK